VTAEPIPSQDAARLERTYDAPAELIWELWTTAAGLEEWFARPALEAAAARPRFTSKTPIYVETINDVDTAH